MTEYQLETDALAATARQAASLMFNEHDLTDGDALPRACTLICEMLIGWTGGDLDVTSEVIGMLLNASAEATTTNDFLAGLTPLPPTGRQPSPSPP